MNEKLNELFDDKRVPLANGIWLACGRFYSSGDHSFLRKLPMRIACTPEPVGFGADLESVSISLLATATAGGIVAVVGNGAFGSDGFVALLGSDSAVRWLAFFDFSNPFTAVSLSGGRVCATNNLGELWAFPVSEPWNIEIAMA